MLAKFAFNCLFLHINFDFEQGPATAGLLPLPHRAAVQVAAEVRVALLRTVQLLLLVSGVTNAAVVTTRVTNAAVVTTSGAADRPPAVVTTSVEKNNFKSHIAQYKE